MHNMRRKSVQIRCGSTRSGILGAVGFVVAMTAATGCEVDSWLNPAIVGRWEPTPVVMPILDQLDIIDEPPAKAPGTTQVRRSDLLDNVNEYVIGPGDLITFTIFELIIPNVETVQTRRVDELGFVRLPVIGQMQVAGLTPSAVEKKLAETLEQMDVVKNAEVSVIVQEGRQRTYSVIGEPRVAGTGIGTYTIPHPNFRLLEAMALARGVPGQIKTLYVIRGANYVQPEIKAGEQGETQVGPDSAVSLAPSTTLELINQLAQGLDEGTGESAGPAKPQTLELAEDDEPRWAHVDNEWVRLDPMAVRTDTSQDEQPGADDESLPPPDSMIPRIVEVPYNRLLDGDMRYNVVIRPGDVIRVPAPVIGNVYIMGAINRGGTYALPGGKDLTLKQLIAAAGNLAETAIPERVDLIRRVNDDQEATVRLDLRAIFNGTQPDFYLKPNDLLNVGTNFFAPPLAVVRNGFRATYGFGFVLDRNFEYDVFGNNSY